MMKNHDPEATLKAIFAEKLKSISIADISRLTKISHRSIQNRLIFFRSDNPYRIDIFVKLAAALDLSKEEINYWLGYYGKSDIDTLRKKFPKIKFEMKRIAGYRKKLLLFSSEKKPGIKLVRLKEYLQNRSTIRKYFN